MDVSDTGIPWVDATGAAHRSIMRTVDHSLETARRNRERRAEVDEQRREREARQRRDEEARRVEEEHARNLTRWLDTIAESIAEREA